MSLAIAHFDYYDDACTKCLKTFEDFDVMIRIGNNTMCHSCGMESWLDVIHGNESSDVASLDTIPPIEVPETDAFSGPLESLSLSSYE